MSARNIVNSLANGRPTPNTPKQIALQHAQILQHRKTLEAQILDDIILLSEYPLSNPPTTSDTAVFKSHVRLFQPSDYDALIEERNVNGLCGYTLCAKPRRQTGPGGEWKLSAGKIVKRKDLERWCSRGCARKALYVKVQLNETAAWERAGIPNIEIEVMDENKNETEEDRTARKLGELKLEDKRQAASTSAALALERGDAPMPDGQTPVKVALREKMDIKAPEMGVFEDEDYLMVEGFKSKRGTEAEGTAEGTTN